MSLSTQHSALSTNNSVLLAEAVSKWYSTSPSPWRRLLAALSGKPGPEGLWALRGVTVAVRPGECLGVIGENGSGKSTLLRLLADLAAPSEGSVQRSGSVASLLDLAAGLDPECTGRENAHLGLRLQGIPRSRDAEMLAWIIGFSELGEAFERPVKTYSAGMRLRLGFAAAVCRKPDILLVDEALSVGDHGFQAKCSDRIRGFLAGGSAAVVASHDFRLIRHLSTRAVWLRGGKVEKEGAPQEVTQAYLNSFVRWGQEASRAPGGPRIERVDLAVSGPGRPSLSVRIAWTAPDPSAAVRLEVGAFRPDGLLALHERSDSWVPARFGPGPSYVTEFRADPLALAPGAYELSVALFDGEGLHAHDHHGRQYRFEVPGPGPAAPACSWKTFPYPVS